MKNNIIVTTTTTTTKTQTLTTTSHQALNKACLTSGCWAGCHESPGLAKNIDSRWCPDPLGFHFSGPGHQESVLLQCSCKRL